MVSYTNSIIGSTALLTSAAQRFYGGFDIQNPAQLITYMTIGTVLGVIISRICNREKNSELENKIRIT